MDYQFYQSIKYNLKDRGEGRKVYASWKNLMHAGQWFCVSFRTACINSAIKNLEICPYSNYRTAARKNAQPVQG